MKSLIVATSNPGKLNEFSYYFKALPIRILSLINFPEIKPPQETGKTFYENALLKAEFIFQKTKTPTIADDSGIIVEALGGEPGVLSARYAKENASDLENNLKLLSRLKEIPLEKRNALFKCVIVLKLNEQKLESVEGICSGYILDAPKGDKGFGYDPLFYYPPLNKTFGEMEPEEKLRISHRGIALQKILPLISEWLKK